MTSRRPETVRALNNLVAPYLRERRFEGRLPHMHRLRDGMVDLFWVQFSKLGDAFTIELGSARPEELRDAEGEILQYEKAKSYNAPRRARLSAGASTTRDKWFSFRSLLGFRRRSPETLARQVLELLPAAERWWEGSEHESHIVPLT